MASTTENAAPSLDLLHLNVAGVGVVVSVDTDRGYFWMEGRAAAEWRYSDMRQAIEMAGRAYPDALLYDGAWFVVDEPDHAV